MRSFAVKKWVSLTVESRVAISWKSRVASCNCSHNFGFICGCRELDTISRGTITSQQIYYNYTTVLHIPIEMEIEINGAALQATTSGITRKLSQTHLYRQLYIIYLLNSSVLVCVCRLLLRWYLLAHYYVLGIFQYRRDTSNTVISNVSHIPLYSPIVPENCLYAKLFLWFAPRGFEPAALAW